MRALLPEPAAEVDLPAAYAYPPTATPDGRPWLRANMVASVDGAIVVAGRSAGLSSPADKRLFALLRDLCDVVLVGAGTARAERYGAVRRSEARVEERQRRGLTDVPAIAVVTRSLAVDPAGPLFAGPVVPTLLLTTAGAAAAHGERFAGLAEIVPAGTGDAVDVAAAVAALHQRGLARILCEGGPTLLADVARAGCLDELCLTIAPLLVGGAAARLLAGGPPLEPPRPLRLAALLEEDGNLFSRWRTEQRG